MNQFHSHPDYHIVNMSRNTKCPHIDGNIVQLPLAELCRMKQGVSCSQCDMNGPNLWICLNKNCLNIGCSEHYNDHSTKHYSHNPLHCIQANQSSQRIWCYKCEGEVFLANKSFNEKVRSHGNDASDDYLCDNDGNRCANTLTASAAATATSTNQLNGFNSNTSNNNTNDIIYGAAMNTNGDSSGDDEYESEQGKFTQWSGLVGLQNNGNTCYMNSALQALSNTPPLTGYFLECGDIVEANYEMAAPSSSQRKAGLAKNYYRFVQEMWLRHKRKDEKFGYIAPSGILYSIRNVHPMFRGDQQHDTQEFLRCFMDQLHEELKEMTLPPPDLLLPNESAIANANSTASSIKHIPSASTDEDGSGRSSPSLSYSEAEYETCDSGVSEQSSLSDELPASSRGSAVSNAIPSIASNQSESPTSRSNYSRSPSPTASQRTLKSTYSTVSTKSAPSNSIGSLTASPLNRTQPTLPLQIDQTDKQAVPIPESSDSTTSASSATAPIPTKKLPHRSIISDVFDGKLLSSVQCLTCDRVSTREETFQDLSLPIPGKDHLIVLHQSPGILSPLPTILNNDPKNQDGWISWLWNWVRSLFWGPAVTLHDCMSAFFSADELKGDNMYSCEKCNKLRNGMKFSRVLELPEMLCVHLKRFRHDLSYSSKISSPVHFPLVGLDMRPYLYKQCKSKISTYDLTAVICHLGVSYGSGHYTSFAKHEISGKWFKYDDELVTEVSPEMVQNCEAYVLFYRKSDPQMATIREQAVQIEDLNTEQTSSIRFFVSRQWLNRFKTFAEPGPIDNWTLLCPHGGLAPHKARIANRLVVPLPQPLWDYLFRTFGGGPVCNHLFECDICRKKKIEITRRQNHELDEFSTYKDETTPTIYAISMQWFRQWQLFVGAVTDEEPGPINNNTILATGEGGSLTRGVRPGSDYAQINSTLWTFFFGIYGGGPEIVLRGNPNDDVLIRPSPTSSSSSLIIHKDRNTAERISEIVADTQSIEKVSHTDASEMNRLSSSNGQVLEQKMYDHNMDNTKSVQTIVENANNSKESKSASVSSTSPPMTTKVTTAPTTIPTTTTATTRKNGKYVSFEDDSSASSDRETNDHLHMRRGKHNHSTSPLTSWEHLLSKKDRRHRTSIQSNGFFGPEGKYLTNNIPADDNSMDATNHEANIIDTPAKKENDEVLPLLYQTNISSIDGETKTTNAAATSDGGNIRSNSHKSYRKRVKMKPNRKHVGFT